MKAKLLATAIVAALTLPATAVAHEAGDILVRIGMTTVAPDASSSAILAGPLDLGSTLPSIGAPLTVDVSNNTQLGLNVAYFITDNINIELLAATPFSHDIEFAAGKLAETDHLPPTITANYFFMDSDSKFQPYIGAGLNYTIFFDEQFDASAVGTVEALTSGDLGAAATVSDLSLDPSFGLAFQAGFDYEVSEGMYVNASVRYININTDANFRISGIESLAINSGSIEKVDIDPLVYTVSLGYKF